MNYQVIAHDEVSHGMMVDVCGDGSVVRVYTRHASDPLIPIGQACSESQQLFSNWIAEIFAPHANWDDNLSYVVVDMTTRPRNYFETPDAVSAHDMAWELARKEVEA